MIVNEKLLFEVSFMTISEHAIMTMKTDAKLNMLIGQHERHVHVMVYLQIFKNKFLLLVKNQKKC